MSSEVLIKLDFEGSVKLRGRLDRVLAPSIVEEIKARCPIKGRATLLRGEMKITLGIKKGIQKPTKEVKCGQIAYMPLGDMLCIYLKDMQTYSAVNVLGSVLNDDLLEKLNDVRRGSMVTITLAE